MCVQKQFVMYKNIDVQRKIFLIKDHRCIVVVNVYKNKTKKKKKKDYSTMEVEKSQYLNINTLLKFAKFSTSREKSRVGQTGIL